MKRFPRRWLWVGLIVGTHLALTVLAGPALRVLTDLLYPFPTFFDALPSFVYAFVGGAAVGQVALLATWAALGPGRLMQRVPVVSMLTVLFWYAVLLSGMLGVATFSADESIALGLVVFGGFVLFQSPLWLVRRSFRWRIEPDEAGPHPDGFKETQFGLRHMLFWTAGIAVLLGLGRLILSGDELRNFDEIIVFTAIATPIVCALAAAMGLPGSWAALANTPRRPGWLMWLIAYCVALSLAERIVLGLFFPVDLTDVFCFNAGQLVIITGTLLLVRRIGYRLIRSGPTTEPTLHDNGPLPVRWGFIDAWAPLATLISCNLLFVAIMFEETSSYYMAESATLFHGGLIAQCSLLAVWTALGRQRLFVRVLGAAAGALLLVWSLHRAVGDILFRELFLPGMVSVTTWALLQFLATAMAAWWIGRWLHRRTDKPVPGDPLINAGPPHVSLSRLSLILVAVAVVEYVMLSYWFWGQGIIVSGSPMRQAEFNIRLACVVGILVSFNTVSVSLFVGAAFARRHAGAWWLAASFAWILVAILHWGAIGDTWDDFESHDLSLSFSVGFFIVAAASLLWVRSANVRLPWKALVVEETPPTPPEDSDAA